MLEEELYARWYAWAHSGQIVHWSGHSLRIIDPGRLNRVSGPDILSARFELDGAIYQGAVEFHREAGDWYRHGHHLDRQYAAVLLHVCPAEAGRQLAPVHHHLNALSVPTLALPPQPAEEARPGSGCPTVPADTELAKAALEIAARERLAFKIRYYEGRLQQATFRQVFYSHFLRALGFPHNADIFQRLALAVEWPLVEHLLKRGHQRDALLALYLGQAGFLPVDPADTYSRFLFALYEGFKDRLNRPPLSASAWTMAALRYHNHPHFRLAGWSELLRRKSLHPADELWTLLAARLPLAVLQKKLTAYFHLPVQGYWQKHYALGRRRKARQNRFFGPQRVDEILFNLLIPLFTARALLQDSTGFAAYLEDIYLSWPAPGWYGFAPRRFPGLPMLLPGPPKACYNQALLHLERFFCRSHRCAVCPLARKSLTSVH